MEVKDKKKYINYYTEVIAKLNSENLKVDARLAKAIEIGANKKDHKFYKEYKELKELRIRNVGYLEEYSYKLNNLNKQWKI